MSERGSEPVFIWTPQLQSAIMRYRKALLEQDDTGTYTVIRPGMTRLQQAEVHLQHAIRALPPGIRRYADHLASQGETSE